MFFHSRFGYNYIRYLSIKTFVVTRFDNKCGSILFLLKTALFRDIFKYIKFIEYMQATL
jgi:hypothetical protein